MCVFSVLYTLFSSHCFTLTLSLSLYKKTQFRRNLNGWWSGQYNYFIIIWLIYCFCKTKNWTFSACLLSLSQNMILLPYSFPSFIAYYCLFLRFSFATPFYFPKITSWKDHWFEVGVFSLLFFSFFLIFAMDVSCDLEVDVNGEEVFMVNKVRILSLLSSFFFPLIFSFVVSFISLCLSVCL